MNKTINITIGGLIFHIEEDAYQKLSRYLEDIKDHLDASLDKNEIITDIESNIAEKFSAITDDKKQVINISDIDELIKVLGTLEDFDQSREDQAETQKSTETQEKRPKKIYRNPDDVIIAGVCSGLAAYFGIDPIILRLIFILSIFFGGSGVIVYIVLWIVMPEAKTATQKLEMHGDPVTLAGIEQTIKSGVEKIQSNGRGEKISNAFRKIISLPFLILKSLFSALKKIAVIIIPVIRIIIGATLLIAMICSLASITFGLGVVTFNANSPYLVSDLPIKEIISAVPFYWGMAALYLVAIIPCLLMTILAITILRKKNSFGLISTSAMLGVWMIALTVVGVIGFGSAPIIKEKYDAIAEAEKTTQIYDLKEFHGVVAGDNIIVNITQTTSSDYRIEASGQKKTLARTRLEVIDGVLKISEPIEISHCFICLPFQPTTFNIVVPQLLSVEGKDASHFNIDKFSGDSLSIKLSDASRLNANVIYKQEITIEESDAARLNITGQANELTAKLSDAAKLSAKELKVKNAYVRASDATRTELTAEGLINFIGSDAAGLRYYGDVLINATTTDAAWFTNIDEE